ncbi:MAG: DnaJ domain-containing protein [Candidatus Riflebacteria bacterium]|nr:DnaJ domain-containing protein [Candidatus Riflebacteria bacterium]
MATQEDLYRMLGVSRTATPDQIRSAYRKLARKFHPDMNPGNKQAEEQFKKVSAAYDVLSDAKKRKLYDEFGEAALSESFDSAKARAFRAYQQRMRTRRPAPPSPDEEVAFEEPGGAEGADLGSLFGGLFGGAGRRRRPRAAAGQDVSMVLELDLLQSLTGAEVQVQISGPSDRSTVTVRIPPGADDGSKLRVSGRGGPGAGGGPPGDLVIETRIRPHPFFRRDRPALTLRLPATIDEAYSGASVEVPTPDGPALLKGPPRSQQGTRLRLRGKGVARSGQRGDLYVELDVRLPDRDDRELAGALERARSLYSRGVREGLKL